MNKYYVSDHGIRIEEIKSETASSVWLEDKWKGIRREAKISSYCAYFDTFDEAFYWALKRAESKLERAKRQTDYAEAGLQEVKGWIEDKTADEVKQ